MVLLRSEWASRVGRVFDTRPRVPGKTTVWLERSAAYTHLARAVERPGGHVCLDGPTGVGKTSLVHTYIAKERVRHLSVMVTQSMDWPSFCRRLIGHRSANESSAAADLEAGISAGLPTAKFKISLGAKANRAEDAAYVDTLARSWSEDDVARLLSEKNALLLVDDLERATDSLLMKVSDLCKLLTQDHVSENAKIVMIGSGDVFHRILTSNPALDERVTQISLGAFKSKNDSRLFMVHGFDKLHLRCPWNSSIPKEFKLRDKCRDAIWDAANGLPKSLNRLGYDIAMRGIARTGVSVTDVLDESHRMLEQHTRQYSQEFPDVISLVDSNTVAASIIKCMYENGITRIHHMSDIMRQMDDELRSASGTAEALEESISELVKIGFIVRTGKSGELIFVKHPTAAHTLGVVARDPTRARHIRFVDNGPFPSRQLSLPLIFSLPKDFHAMDSEAPSEEA